MMGRPGRPPSKCNIHYDHIAFYELTPTAEEFLQNYKVSYRPSVAQKFMMAMQEPDLKEDIITKNPDGMSIDEFMIRMRQFLRKKYSRKQLELRRETAKKVRLFHELNATPQQDQRTQEEAGRGLQNVQAPQGQVGTPLHGEGTQ